MSLPIEELQMPDSLDGADGEQFAQYAELRNAVESHTLGTTALAMEPREMLAEYRSNPHRIRQHLVARDAGRIVGRAMVTTRPLTPETGAYLMVDVLSTHRRRGIGSALADRATALAVDAGASVLKVAVGHTATGEGARVRAATGFGDVPADDDGARFLHSRDFVLEQVSRISMLDVAATIPRWSELRASARTAAGDGYRVIAWTGPTPPKRLAGLSHLRTRMSTDAPSGGLVATEDPWDVDRVVEHDGRISSSGRLAITAAVEHVSSGTLVGFTEILLSDRSATGVQEDTLVLRDHRGHRLGTLLKIEAAELLRREAPHVEAVVTWNAEENRPMLDVNEDMGFRAIGYEGAWQRLV